MKKLFLYIFLVLMFCNVGVAESSLTKCEGNDYKKWTNCFGSYTSDEGRKYTGEFGNEPGKRHGYGTSITSHGYKLVGKFKDDKPDGIGTFSLPVGTVYFSEWNGQMDGLGTFKSKLNSKEITYVGYLKDASPFGYGILISNETKWIGQHNLKANGFIVYVNPDGQVLIGNFKNGILDEKFENIKPQCKGNYSPQWTNCFGEVIIPEAKIIFNTYFVNGDPSSEGAFQILKGGMYPEREGIYVGQFINGESEGQGVKTWNVSESIYVGEWKNGYMHGKGILRRNDGEIYIGNFKKGKKNGHGTILHSDGKKYEGEFLNSFAHGKGICTFEDGLRFDCKMKDGLWVRE